MGLMNRETRVSKTPYCRGGCKAVYQAPAPHNTCRSFWLGTAQQFYHDMRGEGGSRAKMLRPFPAKTTPLGARSTQHMWKLLAGNRTAVLHDRRGEGGSQVWCVRAPCFNLSFKNSELNCSLHKFSKILYPLLLINKFIAKKGSDTSTA